MQNNPETMQELIEGGVQTILAANGALSRLWRVTFYQLGVSSMRWERLLSQYWDEDTKIQGERDKSMKGNLVKGLVEADMSWRSFCRGVTVLNYENAKLIIRLKEDDTKTELPINIGKVYRTYPNTALAWAWGEILNQWPERKANWKKYLSDYADWMSKVLQAEDSVDVRSSMARTLGSDKLMWNMFYKGLCALNMDEIELELQLTHPRKKVMIPVVLTMPNERKAR